MIRFNYKAHQKCLKGKNLDTPNQKIRKKAESHNLKNLAKVKFQIKLVQ